MDAAFRAVPRGCTCFIIWRIENFQLVPVPVDQYGCFFDGDSYLILAALQRGEQPGSLTQVKEVRGNNLDVRIHFWLGENTSQDESGAAAIKAVELDEFLGGTPVQYREVQGRESAVFLNYFKKNCGIKYSPGGHASGFSHVDYIVNSRLILVKGKHCPRMREIPIEWSSMNSGDVYILDVGDVLYVWNGSASSRTERMKALEYVRKLRDDRGGSNIVILDEGEENPESMGEEAFQVFEKYLPVAKKSDMVPVVSTTTDNGFEKKAVAQLKLWRCSEEGSQLKLTEVAHAPLVKQNLDSNDCFIVDNGEDGVWVWCGRNASKREKQEGMNNAAAFVLQRNYASHVQLTKVYEGGEPAEFKALFTVWERERLPGQVKPVTNRIAQTTVQTRFDAATLYDNPQVAMETGMVDDGTGSKKIWRVEHSKDGSYGTVELERKYIGQFYGGDCYVILYTYLVNKQESHIVYYWLGRKSTQLEMGVAALKTVEIDDALGGIAKQVRVVQGKEPNHLLAMFGGRLVIFAGGKAGMGTHQQDEGPGDMYLLQVHGTAAYNTKAEQVPCRPESLNSSDVFVLFSKSGVFVWAGKGCMGDEREMAKQIASVSPRGYHMMTEGQEKDEFWNAIGGKTAYSNSPRLQVDCEERPARLFQCSNASGRFQVTELLDFVQQDLLPEDVFLLDTYDNVYIWLGQDARPEEKTMAMDAALDYIEACPSGRPKGIPVFLIKQGLEPPDFIGYFGVWDHDLWSNGKTYEQLKIELGQKNTAIVPVRTKTLMNGETSFSELAKYPYEVLCRNDKLPEGLDLSHKEKHLKSDEFQQIFGMTYAEFVGLPLWKQQQMKKRCQLF